MAVLCSVLGAVPDKDVSFGTSKLFIKSNKTVSMEILDIVQVEQPLNCNMPFQRPRISEGARLF